MAYQTGTATDVTDLLDKLRIFVAANGWTVNRWEAITNGYWLSIQKSGLYFNFASDTTAGPSGNPGPYIRLRGATGYSAGSAWNAQPGQQRADSLANNLGGPFVAYHFFLGVDYIHVVIEITAGLYRHIAVGELDKAGSYTGGAYAQAVNWNSQGPYTNYPDSAYSCRLFDRESNATPGTGYIRADIDSKTNYWFKFYNTISLLDSARGLTGPGGYGTLLLSRAPNTFNGLSPLLPIFCAVERASQFFSPLGSVKDLRFINIAALAPGATVTLGADEWLCFPFCQKTDTWNVYNSPIPSSGHYGYAYRKVT